MAAPFTLRKIGVPPNSANLTEARRRVFDFFRAACRSIPTIMDIYNLQDVVSPSQLRFAISAQIRNNAHVTDPKVTSPNAFVRWVLGREFLRGESCELWGLNVLGSRILSMIKFLVGWVVGRECLRAEKSVSERKAVSFGDLMFWVILEIVLLLQSLISYAGYRVCKSGKVIDLLLFKGMEELTDIVDHAKQRHHIIGQYVVGEGLVQNTGSKDQGKSDFLKNFYTSNYF
ncbi:hypothetical protein DY000_02004027 [Brassica cretica]|uniref:NADH dehydrogenase [ubiquinone] 1 alpha subcomplex subunit 6 n=1 Tax=Brassica cretica TaxID=69181 RepID=A0ABQ7CFR9_BRACR|nr:hypothetical protein DY000_02004027 [Brassica cretica]